MLQAGIAYPINNIDYINSKEHFSFDRKKRVGWKQQKKKRKEMKANKK
jgi:hypothetical protein